MPAGCVNSHAHHSVCRTNTLRLLIRTFFMLILQTKTKRLNSLNKSAKSDGKQVSDKKDFAHENKTNR
ncbi:hypothetical protein NEIPOLOT_01070 [Neisseria polysaccharea ATCC 43768]|nr:hypothetical protein NEIPOLOT_01070 [Neisseria polysaccharea ATCC 43768]